MYELLWQLKYDLALAAFAIAMGLYGLLMDWRERQRVAAMAREIQEPTP